MATTPPADKTLSDVYAEHQTHLNRFTRGMLKKLVKKVAPAEAVLLVELFELMEDMSPAEKKRFVTGKLDSGIPQKVEKVVKKIEKLWDVASHEMIKENIDKIVKYELDHAQTVLTAIAHIPKPSSPSSADVVKTVEQTPVLGKHTRDYFTEISRKLRDEIMSELTASIMEDLSPKDIKIRIRGTKEQNYRDGVLGRLLRRLEGTSDMAINSATNTSREQYWLANGVEDVYWRSVLDGRTSNVCATRDGNIYPIGKGPRPPAHPNCRSVILPYLGHAPHGTRPYIADKRKVKDIPLDERDSVDHGRVFASTNFETWFNSRSAKFQKEWLGPSRYKLYKEGGYSIKRFVDPRGKKYNLRQLAARDRQTFKDLGIKLPPRRNYGSPGGSSGGTPSILSNRFSMSQAGGWRPKYSDGQKEAIRKTIMKHSRENRGYEYSILINRSTGDIISQKLGQEYSVDLEDGIRYAEKHGITVDIHHNHPTSSSLSAADIQITGHPNVGDIYAYGKNGNNFAGTLNTGRVYTQEGWEQAHARVQAATQMSMFVHARDFDQFTSNQIYGEALNRRLADLGIIQYASELPNWSVPDEFTTQQEIDDFHQAIEKVVEFASKFPGSTKEDIDAILAEEYFNL